MMEDYHKISVKNVCIVNICFQKKGELFNQGRIVLDIDTYDFAGHITDDVIVGFYKNGIYYIYYYYNKWSFDVDPSLLMTDEIVNQFEEYEIQMSCGFGRNKLPEDFTDVMMKFDDGNYVIRFEGIVSERETIQRYLEYNQDLLKPRK